MKGTRGIPLKRVFLALLAGVVPCVAQPAPPSASGPGTAAPDTTGQAREQAKEPSGTFPAPNVTPFYRVVPKNEARTLAFLTYLFPDCSPQGPVVLRLLEKPEHGTVTFEEGSSYPRYAAGSPLAACNAKRVPGTRLTFETAEGYEGLDAFRVLVINPDGTASELDGRVSIR